MVLRSWDRWLVRHIGDGTFGNEFTIVIWGNSLDLCLWHLYDFRFVTDDCCWLLNKGRSNESWSWPVKIVKNRLCLINRVSARINCVYWYKGGNWVIGMHSTKQFGAVENPGFWYWTFTLHDENQGVLAVIDRNWRGFGFEVCNSFVLAAFVCFLSHWVTFNWRQLRRRFGASF